MYWLRTEVKCNKLNVIDENGWMGLAIGHNTNHHSTDTPSLIIIATSKVYWILDNRYSIKNLWILVSTP